MNFFPFPVLVTKRLILREMTELDRTDLFTMRSDPCTHAYTDTAPDENEAQTLAYIGKLRNGVAENRWIIWAIEHRDSKRVIGTLGIWNIDAQQNTAELSYGLAPEFQGKGYMNEAIAEAIAYGFREMKLSALEAYTEEQNLPSQKLLGRMGFSEKDHVDDVSQDGKRVYHMSLYKLERETYETKLTEI